MMNKSIKLSLIVPTYNVENYIGIAIESVLMQNLQEIEIVCIDNCSEDRTVAIIQQYMISDDRIRLIRNNENKGVGYSRNRGIAEARGEYILFLDSDDELVPDSLEDLYQIAEENRADVVFFDAIARYENAELEKKFGHYKPDREGKIYQQNTGKELFAAFVADKLYTDVLWRQCFKREYIQNNRLFFEGNYHEDVVFSFKAILKAERVKCINKKIYIYNRRSNSLTTDEKQLSAFKCEFENYCKMLRFSLVNESNTEVANAIEWYLNDYYEHINNKFKYTKKITSVQFDNMLEKMMFRNFVLNRNLMCEHIDELAQYDKLVIYGAGYMASRLLHEFSDPRILGVAVTNIAGNPPMLCGFQVKELEFYKEWANEAVVIVAVVKRNQEEMIMHLLQQGFKNYICI